MAADGAGRPAARCGGRQLPPRGDGRRRGVFVAVEGIDRSGKTTLTRALVRDLAARGLRVGAHREPSDGPIGAVFRRVSDCGGPSPLCMALLSAADRLERQPLLAKRLDACEVVVSDRYFLSGIAYHAAEGIAPEAYLALNAGVRRPDAYLYLDVAPGVAAQRGGPPQGRWEAHDLAVRLPDAYEQALHLAMAEGVAVHRLDAHQPPEQVAADALAVLSKALTLPVPTARIGAAVQVAKR